MIYIWSRKDRATDMLATFHDDGSNSRTLATAGFGTRSRYRQTGS